MQWFKDSGKMLNIAYQISACPEWVVGRLFEDKLLDLAGFFLGKSPGYDMTLCITFNNNTYTVKACIQINRYNVEQRKSYGIGLGAKIVFSAVGNVIIVDFNSFRRKE